MDEVPYPPLLGVVAAQLNVSPAAWALYASRDQTRREYLVELQQRFGFQPFTQQLYRKFIGSLGITVVHHNILCFINVRRLHNLSGLTRSAETGCPDV
jgi:Domain of unknown function (DUF4158)